MLLGRTGALIAQGLLDKMRTLMIIIMFLLLGAFFIVSNSNLHLSEKEEFMKFGNAYYSWLGSLLDNGVSVVGYVAKAEWLPSDNSSVGK